MRRLERGRVYVRRIAFVLLGILCSWFGTAQVRAADPCGSLATSVAQCGLGDHFRSGRALVDSLPSPVRWLIPPTPKSDQIALNDVEIAQAITTASRSWAKKCFKVDSLDATSRSGVTKSCIGVVRVNWLTLEKLRSSSARLARAVAAFTPFADETGFIAGGAFSISIDPALANNTAAVWTNYVQQSSEEAPEDGPDLPPGRRLRRASSGYFPLSFPTMIMHEYGHSLGLEDVGRSDSVMLSDIYIKEHLTLPSDCDCAAVRKFTGQAPISVKD